MGIRGMRKSGVVFINGDLLLLRKPLKIGHSLAIVMPKEWLYVLENKAKGKDPVGFTLQYDENKLVVMPYYGEEAH